MAKSPYHPQTITEIEGAAFSGCTGLQTIAIPNGVIALKNSTFYNCTALSSITIPYGVNEIGDYCFSKCTSLANISIPESVTSIGNNVFDGCSNLQSIEIPDSVTTIGSCVFSYCTSLSSIMIPRSISSIGVASFRNCEKLTSITIPSNITSIGEWAFENCYELSNIDIAGIISEIGDESFLKCYELSVVTVPACNTYTVQWFRDNGFENALVIGSHIATVIENSVEPTETEAGLSEGSYCLICSKEVCEQHDIPALNDMSVLRLPSSLLIIENEAFYHLDCQAVIIPDGCTTIGDKAFAYNDELLYVKVPVSVKTMSDDAFEGCDNVTVFRDEN